MENAYAYVYEPMNHILLGLYSPDVGIIIVVVIVHNIVIVSIRFRACLPVTGESRKHDSLFSLSILFILLSICGISSFAVVCHNGMMHRILTNNLKWFHSNNAISGYTAYVRPSSGEAGTEIFVDETEECFLRRKKWDKRKC